ncbi:MAG: hypothetical protein JNJ99_04310, partial [Crocinitomicaceae bacterium]|nr:hypothetical protein [Crocinitomicaceae bacterium]
MLLFAFVKIGMAQEPTFDWVTNSGAANIEYAYGVTTDAAGNVYSIGVFSGTMDFDPGPGTLNLTSVGMYDMYVQKQDSDGNLIWAKSFGSTDVDFIKGITVSSTGEIYLCGNFFLTCDFDPGPGVANKTSGGSTDPFILKLDNNGNFLWVKTFSSVSQGSAEELITDLSGNVYVAGSFNGTTDFDPDFGTFNLTSAGFSDIFICKLGSDGSLIWAKKVGGTDSDLARDINLDASGNVFICGGFESASVDFDPGAGTFSLIQAGLGDAYLLKLNSGGNFVNAV